MGRFGKRPRRKCSLVLLVVLSCGGQQMSGSKEVSGSPPRLLSANNQGPEQLAGDWKLSLWLPPHGILWATLHLQENGHGQYLVTATGIRS
jgi:hypothetical protein